MRISILTVLLLSWLVGNAGRISLYQTTKADCPAVYVNCPVSCESDERPCTFTAVVKGGEPGRKLSYSWVVSKGKIKSGQGTETITVDLSGLSREERTGVTGAVEIGGVDKKCGNAVSCTTAVY